MHFHFLVPSLELLKDLEIYDSDISAINKTMH